MSSSRVRGEGVDAGEVVNTRYDNRKLTFGARVEVGWSVRGYLEASDAAYKCSITYESSAGGRNFDNVGSGGRGSWMASPCDCCGSINVNRETVGAAWGKTRAR